MDGVLNIDKPRGITSHDVVQQVRRLLKEKRIGHTGTLDPLATGVLVLCVGKATRIARFLEAGEKEYEAIMRLGIMTDTLDSDGRTVEAKDYDPPGLPQVLNAIRKFTGPILQSPPAFSAVKVGGVPSYKLARIGKAKPHMPRPVTIHNIDLIDYKNPLITIRVRCSKGVYIRTLCADIGNELNAGAHLTSLARIRSGGFTVEKGFTLNQVAQACSDGSIDRIMVTMDKALEDIRAVTLSDNDSKRIANGCRVACSDASAGPGEGLIRVHTRMGELIALARAGGNELVPEIVFPEYHE